MPATTSPRRKRRTVREKLEIIELTRTWSHERAASTYGVSVSTIRLWRAYEETFRQQDAVHAITSNEEERIQPPQSASELPLDQAELTTSGISTAPPPSHSTDATVAPSTLASSQERQSSAPTSALIGYAGLRGTVAEVAVKTFSPLIQIGVATRASKAITTIGYAHTIDAMEAVVRREVQYCVVPSNWLLSISASFALAKFSSFPLCIAAESFCKPPLC
jgi:hypothetical protein